MKETVKETVSEMTVRNPKDHLYELTHKLYLLTKWTPTACRKFTQEEISTYDHIELAEGKYGYNIKFYPVDGSEPKYIATMDEPELYEGIKMSDLYLIELKHPYNGTIYRVSTVSTETVPDIEAERERIDKEIYKEKVRLTALGIRITIFDTCIPY